jgi:hypothetical protein
MATIRLAMIAGAALVVLHATAAPVGAQNRQAGPPLQLVPGADQATGGMKARTATTAKSAKKKSATDRSTARKATRKAAKKPPDAKANGTERRNARAGRAVAKAPATKRSNRARIAQPNAGKSTRIARPQANGVRARADNGRNAQKAIAAALPEVREQEKETQDTAGSMAFAPMPSQHQVVPAREEPHPASRPQSKRDHVMRDGDSVSLIGRLPWWRNNPLQPIHYGSKEAASQVLAAADAWLVSEPVRPEHVLPDDGADAAVVIAEANELNAIDRALMTVPTPPSLPTFWHSLIAILGGVIAAGLAAAASARFVFARA